MTDLSRCPTLFTSYIYTYICIYMCPTLFTSYSCDKKDPQSSGESIYHSHFPKGLIYQAVPRTFCRCDAQHYLKNTQLCKYDASHALTHFVQM